ncbi:MAG: cytochrome c3 family protein [Gammaproteobacteria bacterium]|nr:cytochrome c3 family protein [Gammaproteobacteria bacterium]
MNNNNTIMLLLIVFLVSACTKDTMSLFFDVPPPTVEEMAQKRAAEAAQRLKPQDQTIDDQLKLKKLQPHELAGKLAAATEFNQAMQYLPKDMFGQPDWLAAMDQNIIWPRSHIGTDNISKFVFGFDFFLKGPTPVFDAWFPHSRHTELLDCASCHPKVFKYRGTPITMAEIRDGKYCGTCHGKVAFPVDVACARCHTGMLGGQ